VPRITDARPKFVPAFRGWWPFAAVAIAGVVLRSIVPMDIVWGSGHDSQLQIVLARNIGNGYWLGAERIPEMWIGSQWNLALAKGVGYPFFLVLVKPTGLNPVMAAYLVYLVGAFMVARAVIAWSGRRWGLAMFVLLVFSPAPFGGEFSRVYRNNLIAALGLLALGLALSVSRRLHEVGTPVEGTDPSLRRTKHAPLFVRGTLLGSCFGVLWITRLDVHWIAFACAVPIVIAAWPRLLKSRAMFTVMLPLGVCVLVSAVVLPLSVAMMNRAQYGIFATDDYGSGPIAETQILLSRIEATPSHPLVHVNAEQRNMAYGVSQSLKRISAQLEDPASPWKGIGGSPGAIGESSAWFSWELRDAPVKAGIVSTLAELHDFFGAAEQELRLACENGTLQCTAPGEFAPGVRFITQVDRELLREQFASALRVHARGAGAPNFFNLTPLGIPDLDALWTQTVNGVDTVAAPRQVTWPARYFGRISTWLTGLALVSIPSAAVALGRRRRRPRWNLLLIGGGCLAGSLINALIVTWFSVEIGVSTENNAGYLFAAQSFFYVGLFLLFAALVQPLFGVAQRFRGANVPESGLFVPGEHSSGSN